MKIKNIIIFIICILGPLALGSINGLLINYNSYMEIIKPALSPPAILFPIVWSILYVLMGLSFYIIIKNNYTKKSILFFILQLLANLIWPFIFFSLKWYYFAALEIILLIYLVVCMIGEFINIKKSAGLLQLPYFFWLLFALYLNIGIALLN